MESNPDEPVDLSVSKSFDSNGFNSPEDQLDLSQIIDSDECIDMNQAIDSDESINMEEPLSQAIDLDEPINMEELISRLKGISRKKFIKIIRREMSSLAELSSTYVERKIRGLQDYRHNYYNFSFHWSPNEYISETLPRMLAFWWFNTSILKDEYYRELVNTVIFIAKEIGSLKTIEKVAANLIEIDDYIAFGDRANLVKKQCHKMAIETIAKIMSINNFGPTKMCQDLKEILICFIREHKNGGIQDPAMQDYINMIVNKLDIGV